MINSRIGRDVFRDTNFRRYFLGQGLSGFGDTLVPLALAFAVLKLTGSATELGIVLLASRIPLTVFTLIGGSVGDRLPRCRVLIVADVTRMIAHGVTAILLLTGEARLWHLIVLQAIAGTATAFFDPAAAGLIRDVVPEDRLAEANAFLGLSRSTLAMLAIATSGALVATVGAGWSFALNSASFAASVWFLKRLCLQTEETTRLQSGYFAHIAQGFAYVRSRRWLIVTIAYTALLNAIVIAPLMVLGPVIAQNHLGGAASWAAILIATAFGSFFGATLSMRVTVRRPLVSAFGVAFGALPFAALLAIAAPLSAIASAAVFFGIQTSFSNITIRSLVQRRVEPDLTARVTSYISLGSLLLAPFGFALAGVAADRFGAADVLWCCAAWLSLSTIGALLIPDVRSMKWE